MPRAASRGAIVVPIYRAVSSRVSFPTSKLNVEVGARVALQTLPNVLSFESTDRCSNKSSTTRFPPTKYFKCPVFLLFKLNRTLSSISIVEFTLHDLGKSEKSRYLVGSTVPRDFSVICLSSSICLHVKLFLFEFRTSLTSAYTEIAK